jgi:hypothetical protein
VGCLLQMHPAALDAVRALACLLTLYAILLSFFNVGESFANEYLLSGSYFGTRSSQPFFGAPL